MCVFCDGSDHKSTGCTKVTDLNERKKIFSSMKLCFNCSGSKHRASECKSKTGCQTCGAKHHSSLCEKADTLLVTSSSESVIHPVVVVRVKGVRCRALLDTAAGSSYISSAMVRHLGMKANRTEQRRIEMLMANTVKTFNIHELEISNDNGTFTLETEVTQVDRDVIMKFPNPQYQNVLKKYSHLKGVKIIDEGTKKELPVQIIVGASDYSRIKTSTGTRVGNPGEPIAEYTRLGWTLMSPGKVGEHESMMLTRSTIEDYSQLYALDVLGLEDKPDGDQSTVYDEFKEQLVRSKEGWYETKLPWKANHPELPNNKEGSLGRLNSLVK